MSKERLEKLVEEQGIKGFVIEEAVTYDSYEISDSIGIELPEDKEYLAHTGCDQNGSTIILITEDYPSYNPIVLLEEFEVIYNWNK